MLGGAGRCWKEQGGVGRSRVVLEGAGWCYEKQGGVGGAGRCWEEQGAGCGLSGDY